MVTPTPHQGRQSMTRRKKLLLILLLLAVLGSALVWWNWFGDPLPDPSQITSIHVTSYHPSPNRHVAFDLNYSDWLILRNSLTTPIWDAVPGTYPGLAQLQIYTRGVEVDNVNNLWLFDTDQPRGAFSFAP